MAFFPQSQNVQIHGGTFTSWQPTTTAEYVKEDPVRRIFEKILKPEAKVSREERFMLKALQESYSNLLKTVIHGNLDWSANVEPLKAKAEHLTALAGIVRPPSHCMFCSQFLRYQGYFPVSATTCVSNVSCTA
jgi:hypothetical protein